MQIKSPERKPLGQLPVVKNFMQVIEKRDINLMNKELYQFLNLYCGFIAHYNSDGFKAAYSCPRDFAGYFIRHFDREHRYFNGIYQCHNEPYKDTGYTKAEVKQEFFLIVDEHKAAISEWAEQRQRDERHAIYLNLKKEFGAEKNGLKVTCDTCGRE
jgi:hypothetical protein